MSPAGRPSLNAATAVNSIAARNHGNPVTSSSTTTTNSNNNNNNSADRRLRSNNNNHGVGTTPAGGAAPRPTSRRPSAANTPVKSTPASIKQRHHNDIPQRILAILESVPSTISVSAHPSDSLPPNFASLNSASGSRGLRSEDPSPSRYSHEQSLDGSEEEEEEEEFRPDEYDDDEDLPAEDRRTLPPTPPATTTGMATRRLSGHNPHDSKSHQIAFKHPPPHRRLKNRAQKRHAGGGNSRRESRQHSLTPSSAAANGMPPPPQLPNKMHFRARALDPQRQMPIHIVRKPKKAETAAELEMLYNNTVLKRPLFNVPSGMEKEEERELHLRKAIEAQRAQTSGATGEGHFIPIREVELVDPTEYQRYCRWRKVVQPPDYWPYKRGEFDFCDEDTSYDADEEDMLFLRDNNFFISVDLYEKIVEKLEVSSRERVPSIYEFNQQHPEILLEYLERVYDFWISRRMKLIKELKMPASLVPYVPRRNKPGEKDNPYIAFRHRGPRVTTRRKQRLETEHYGSMLRLAAAVRRTHILTKSLVERETLKLKLVDASEELFNDELAYADANGAAELPAITHQPKTDPRLTLTIPYANKWLSRVWNEVARDIQGTKPLSREESLLAIATRYGPEDGRFTFERQSSCAYRTHRSGDPFSPESTSSRLRAIQTIKRKFRDESAVDVGPISGPTPSTSQDQSFAVSLLDRGRSDGLEAIGDPRSSDPFGAWNRFVSVDEGTWERLSGEQPGRAVLCRSRFGRGGRLKLDFLYKQSSQQPPEPE